MAFTPGSISVVVVEGNLANKTLLENLSSYSRVKWDLRFISGKNEAAKFISGQGKYAGAKAPDLILLDVHLPKADAWEILRKIKVSHRLGSVPTLILCGPESDEDLSRAKDLGVAAVTKPRNLGELSTLIDRIEWFWKKNAVG